MPHLRAQTYLLNLPVTLISRMTFVWFFAQLLALSKCLRLPPRRVANVTISKPSAVPTTSGGASAGKKPSLPVFRKASLGVNEVKEVDSSSSPQPVTVTPVSSNLMSGEVSEYMWPSAPGQDVTFTGDAVFVAWNEAILPETLAGKVVFTDAVLPDYPLRLKEIEAAGPAGIVVFMHPDCVANELKLADPEFKMSGYTPAVCASVLYILRFESPRQIQGSLAFAPLRCFVFYHWQLRQQEWPFCAAGFRRRFSLCDYDWAGFRWRWWVWQRPRWFWRCTHGCSRSPTRTARDGYNCRWFRRWEWVS